MRSPEEITADTLHDYSPTLFEDCTRAGMVAALRDELQQGCPHKCADDKCPFYRRIDAKLAELGEDGG